jgi:hypothetical protein
MHSVADDFTEVKKMLASAPGMSIFKYTGISIRSEYLFLGFLTFSFYLDTKIMIKNVF